MTDEKASSPKPAKKATSGERYHSLFESLPANLKRSLAGRGQAAEPLPGFAAEEDAPPEEEHPYGYIIFTGDRVAVSRFATPEALAKGLAKQFAADEETTVVPFVGRTLPVWIRSDHVVVGPTAPGGPHWRADRSGHVTPLGVAEEALGEPSDYTHVPEHLYKPPPILPPKEPRKKKRQLPD